MTQLPSWEVLLETWAEHAKLQCFQRRVRLAIQTIGEAIQLEPKRFVGVSGGKDSCALAGLIEQAGLIDRVRLVFCRTPLDTPGSDETVAALAEHLDANLDVVDPEVDLWTWLATIPREWDLLGEHYNEFLYRFSSVNLSIAYMYEHDYLGVFLGLRTQESRGRRINRMVRGKDYKLRDDTMTCQPIVDWQASDVFAYAVWRGLPIHPYYRLALERMGLHPEAPNSRVGCMLPEDCVVQWNVMFPLKTLYPDLWRRVVSLRPELRER
jgi:3'-phosphoadenosine 5'-phosphosulfate sulfotransferase (PAPS reductase)/FAD synthetase